jgi:hypothetical protein
MSDPPFRVLGFSEGNLWEALSNPHVSAAEVRLQRRAKYLHGYLDKLQAQSIVVETDYTDGDYLDDFAAYYVKCFAPYQRRCKRLHFFKAAFDEQGFLKKIRGPLSKDEEDQLRGDYLGFVVARPLPQAIVGRTVLRTYDSDGGRRNYTCTRQYKVNLFGLELSLPSLAFQEQDTVLAACATVALWSCFQKTAELFGTPTPTPAVITRVASQAVHHGRPIPSHGLMTFEICAAIRHVGLEPEVFTVRPSLPVVSLIYAYLKMGLPVVLGVEVEGVGRHAIALTGYSISEQRKSLHQEVAEPPWAVPMAGLRVDAFFGHDDQIGPFSRVAVKPSAKFGKELFPVCFESDWADPNTGRKLPLYPHVVIVPAYHKIRLTFLDVLQWLTRLTEVLKLVVSSPLEWDVHLMLSNDYKTVMRDTRRLQSDQLERVLLTQHPRFVWRALLMVSGVSVAELLFDATGISRSLPMDYIIWYEQDFALKFKQILESSQLEALLIKFLKHQFLNYIKDSIRNQFTPPALFPALAQD